MIQRSMSLRYEPSSELLHILANQPFFDRQWSAITNRLLRKYIQSAKAERIGELGAPAGHGAQGRGLRLQGSESEAHRKASSPILRARASFRCKFCRIGNLRIQVYLVIYDSG